MIKRAENISNYIRNPYQNQNLYKKTNFKKKNKEKADTVEISIKAIELYKKSIH